MMVILNLMFWIAVAYLAIAVVWRYFVPALRGSRPRPGRLDGSHSSGAEQFFARSRVFPLIALALLLIPLAVQSTKALVDLGWTEGDKTELKHFTAAMDYYDQATQLASLRGKDTEDWETIKALLEVAQSEATVVGDTVLAKLDDDMPALYREKFLAGLRMGVFGLTQHNLGIPKGQTSLPYNAEDSMSIGRQLLAEWDDWYLPRRQSIAKAIGNAAGEDEKDGSN